jgi:hypothetical protein
MRAFRVLVTAAIIAALRAQQNPPMPDQDPFVGTWRANAAQSKPKLNKTEASYERVIARNGDELLFSSTGGRSKEKARAYRLRCDDRFYPLPTGPVLRCIYVSPRRVDGQTVDPNGEHDYWTREVSPDGKRMTISAYKDSRRVKVRSVMVLDRIK